MKAVTTCLLCATAAFVTLTACATKPTAFDQCAVTGSEGWSLTQVEPANREALLRLATELNSGDSRKEAWFSQGPEALMICRYQDLADDCASRADLIQFRRIMSTWSAGDLLEKVCVTGHKSGHH
jgi:hypothetical protein